LKNAYSEKREGPAPSQRKMFILFWNWKRNIMGKVIPASAVITLVALIVYFGLPLFLNAMGLHTHYRGRNFDLDGRKALIITTSRGILGDTGKKTGVYASEMTAPYYEFFDAKMQVDVASIDGGEIPIEPLSLNWPVSTPSDHRFLKDSNFQKKVKNSLKLPDVDFTRYDLVYMAGGWGAAYDLGTSEVLGRKISEAYSMKIILGSVCHGALGFLQAKDENGTPLVKGRKMTAVTDKQIKELGIEITPQHPERELRAAGALFEAKTAFRDVFANHIVIDGTIVTGQNQNAGAETAQRMMALLKK
jgi:putative intracellular protease/amidase